MPLDIATRPKFFALKNLFWIKHQDFMDIVPRHPHLSGLNLIYRAIMMHEDPFSIDRWRDGRPYDGGQSEKEGKGRDTGLVNGYR